MRRRTMVSFVMGACVLVAPVLHAKDVVGVYCLPDKVVLGPSRSQPERIQIWGAFLVADRATPDAYLPVERGYLYYSCPSGRETTCRIEWSDLESAAGKGLAVGFGSRFLANGRVRASTEAIGSPDPYPMQFGVVRLGSDQHAAALLAALRAPR